MLVTGLLALGLLLAAAVAIRSRAPGRRPPPLSGSRPSPERDVSPERRLWAIWKRLGWGERFTMLALVIGGLGAVSFALFGLVLLVW